MSKIHNDTNIDYLEEIYLDLRKNANKKGSLKSMYRGMRITKPKPKKEKGFFTIAKDGLKKLDG